MAEHEQGATFILSIDLVPLTAEHLSGAAVSDDHVVKSIAPVVARHRVPATWGLASPAESTAVARLMAVSPEQEVALLGDAEPSIAARRPLASRVADTVAHAQETGYRLSTLVLRNTQLGDDWRSVVQHGITAISGSTSVECAPARRSVKARRTVAADGETGPRAIRYGLWEFPVRLCFCGKTSLWSLASSCLRARQAIDRAVATGGVAHLLVDGPSYCAAESRVQRWLDRLLEHVARRRDQGRLATMPVGDMVLQLLQTPRGEPARSILHDAPTARSIAA